MDKPGKLLRSCLKTSEWKGTLIQGAHRILLGKNSMRHSIAVLTILFCSIAFIGCGQDTNGPEPDNTLINERDRNPGALTADQQHESDADRALTQKIRQSVMADESLSMNAKNIKIISQNGAVTLKGPVNSETEKQAILAKAVAVTADAAKVVDEISVSN